MVHDHYHPQWSYELLQGFLFISRIISKIFSIKKISRIYKKSEKKRKPISTVRLGLILSLIFIMLV